MDDLAAPAPAPTTPGELGRGGPRVPTSLLVLMGVATTAFWLPVGAFTRVVLALASLAMAAALEFHPHRGVRLGGLAGLYHWLWLAAAWTLVEFRIRLP